MQSALLSQSPYPCVHGFDGLHRLSLQFARHPPFMYSVPEDTFIAMCPTSATSMLMLTILTPVLTQLVFVIVKFVIFQLLSLPVRFPRMWPFIETWFISPSATSTS